MSPPADLNRPRELAPDEPTPVLPEPPRGARPARLRFHVALAVGLLFIDGFALAQGALAGIVTVIMVLLGMVHLVIGLFGDRARVRTGAAMIAIYGLMMASVVATINANNQLASRRAGEIVVALNAYRSTTGDYPARLADLVPAYLPAVPRAKYTLMFDEFTYHHDPGKEGGFLMYAVLPPFGRRTYSLDRSTWGSLD